MSRHDHGRGVFVCVVELEGGDVCELDGSEHGVCVSADFRLRNPRLCAHDDVADATHQVEHGVSDGFTAGEHGRAARDDILEQRHHNVLVACPERGGARQVDAPVAEGVQQRGQDGDDVFLGGALAQGRVQLVLEADDDGAEDLGVRAELSEGLEDGHVQLGVRGVRVGEFDEEGGNGGFGDDLGFLVRDVDEDVDGCCFHFFAAVGCFVYDDIVEELHYLADGLVVEEAAD